MGMMTIFKQALKVHHGKKAAAWLDRHQDKIELFFLPPYAPESDPDEYLNHALKLSIHSGGLPQTKRDIRHKTASFMRTLPHCFDKVSAFFQHNQISYVLIREQYVRRRISPDWMASKLAEMRSGRQSHHRSSSSASMTSSLNRFRMGRAGTPPTMV